MWIRTESWGATNKCVPQKQRATEYLYSGAHALLESLAWSGLSGNESGVRWRRERCLDLEERTVVRYALLGGGWLVMRPLPGGQGAG